MKKLAGLLALALLALPVWALAQVSDYEIIQTYKSRHRVLLEAIKASQDPGRHGDLESQVVTLEGDYAQHRRLLDDGLHPEGFDRSIAALRDQLGKTAERLSLIEERRQDKATIATISRKVEADAETIGVLSRENAGFREAIEKLTREVADLSGRIEKLDAENAGLLESIKRLQQEKRRDKASIAALEELTAKLRDNVRSRDDLIVRMMGSLFDEYSKSNLTEAQKHELFVNAQGNDYVGRIIATIDGNVDAVGRTVMLPQDVGLIKEEERKVAAKWEAIKPYVGKLYPDEQAGARDLGRVDGRLAEWRRSIGETTWKSIQRVFADQGIDVGTFGSAGEFQARLLAYLDQQINAPSRAKYRTFRSKVWDSPIKDQWLPVIPTEELTAKQRADIEERVALWGKKVAALLWRFVLAGILGLAVLTAVAVVVMRRRKP